MSGAKAGWITLVVRRCQFNSCAVDVFLTPNGAEESKGWKKTSDKVWMVPIFQREFIEVTGITGSEPSTAVAEFTSQWIPTDYGKELGAVTSAPRPATPTFACTTTDGGSSNRRASSVSGCKSYPSAQWGNRRRYSQCLDGTRRTGY
jgi:hypothetical protein